MDTLADLFVANTFVALYGKLCYFFVVSVVSDLFHIILLALAIPKATVIGAAEEVSESLVDRFNAGGETNSNLPTKSRRKNEALYRNLLQGKLYDLSQKERQLIESLLKALESRLHNFQVLPRLDRRRSLIDFGGTVLDFIRYGYIC